jgi:hypothetical protein
LTNPLRWQRLLSIQIYSYLDPQELLLYLQERLSGTHTGYQSLKYPEIHERVLKHR